MIDRTVALWTKIERAKEHVTNLESEVLRFFETRPYEVFAEGNNQSRERIIRVRVNADPPPRWSAVIGDVLHNLACALDGLVWQVVLANGGRPGRHTKFPFAGSSDDFEAQYPRKVKGTSQIAVDLIKATKPYKGGNNGLWLIHQLNVIDKHRLLIAVGAAHRHIKIDLTPTIRHVFPDVPPNPMVFNAPDSKYPLKNGAELLRLQFESSEEMYVQTNFTFDIAFGEGEIVKGESLIPTLRQSVKLVESVMEPFRPLLVC